MFMENNKYCRECICPTCEAFKTNECLVGESGCERCSNNSRIVSCGYFVDAFNNERKGEDA